MDSVLITGSGTGLGRATAFHLARSGFRVYATVPTPEQAEETEALARREGVPGLQVRLLDITDRESIQENVDTIHRETGGPFALVNNAGVGLRGFFEDLEEDEIRRLFEINVFGTMAVTRAVIPLMRANRRGRIVMITSIGGRIGNMGISSYGATKFAQEGFGEALYQELLPFGIRVILIEPAITKTERWDIHRGECRRARSPESPYAAWFRRAEALADRMVETTPTKPEHVAEAVRKALTVPHPRLRILVGPRARAVYTLRRYLPEALFERVYFGAIIRRVTQPRSGDAP